MYSLEWGRRPCSNSLLIKEFASSLATDIWVFWVRSEYILSNIVFQNNEIYKLKSFVMLLKIRFALILIRLTHANLPVNRHFVYSPVFSRCIICFQVLLYYYIFHNFPFTICYSLVLLEREFVSLHRSNFCKISDMCTYDKYSQQYSPFSRNETIWQVRYIYFKYYMIGVSESWIFTQKSANVPTQSSEKFFFAKLCVSLHCY